MSSRPLALLFFLVSVASAGAACGSPPDDGAADDDPGGRAPAGGPAATANADGGTTSTADAGTAAVTPEVDAPFFGAAYIEDAETYRAQGSDGDLWPSCWSDDDALYTANGDGKGYGATFADIAVSRVTGMPPSLAGTVLARGDQVARIWTAGGRYNRKPTGMLCADGAIYLAVQDLELDFMDAPAATIVASRDHGKTWSSNRMTPMFAQHVMTTLMFLDFGKDNANAIDGYAYVYGLDQNWRFSTRVPSPTKLWLARVPKGDVQNRAAWTFYAGTGASGAPRFEADIAKRQPVLEDATKIYGAPYPPQPFGTNMTRLSQGSIVYDAPLKRYIYASWTEYTFELYEAPAPWGPWKHFLTRDYGVYPWSPALNGGYATTIPSKFISADGKTMFVQSNTFTGGVSNYLLSFRKLYVDPFVLSAPANAQGPQDLAKTGGARPIFRAGHAGPTALLLDGVKTGSIDSWTGDPKSEDFWGVVWPRAQTVNVLRYTTGNQFPDGGWFESIRVQVRKNGEWVDVAGTTVTPPYPGSAAAGSNVTYAMTFAPTAADGVRVIGKPGGSRTFTSASEIEVYYR